LSTTINLMEQKNKAKVINRPTTVVQNGHEAIIHVGDTVYYETLSGFQNGTPFYSTSSLDTGVTLRVRPMISKDGIVTMEISSNVADEPTYNPGPSGTELPTIHENSNATIVQMHDNETLVVGGLRQSTTQEQTQGVPLLDKIPLVGALFRNKQTTPSDNELVILVRPEVLHSGKTAPVTGAAASDVP
jgi:general secretion pathway protein D